jgi:glycosyltransferase involved in cell wall biosynthesis
VPPATTIVVPCFNEAARLRPEGFRPLLERPGLTLLFVDDGSTDDTAARLREIAGGQVLALGRNGGKSEAVRQGMLRALAGGAEITGYLDADLATPADEMLRLLDLLVATAGVDTVLGSRVLLLGRDIRRRASRHYLGRVFATAASAVLGAPIYDTQCGAKLFRVTPALREALSEPFHSRWAFDVELLGRLLPRDGRDLRLLEVPLHVWHDVAGSTLRLPQMVRAGLEVGRIGVELARWRRKRG